MLDRVSAVLKISHEALDAAGVFDRYVDIDSSLHIDPHLLAASGAPEMKAAAQTLDKYWEEMILVVDNIEDDGDPFWREAVRRFTFPENTCLGLGYSTVGKSGRAIGEETAKKLVDTAKRIVAAGVKDPRIFELVGVFEEKIGPDKISDITAHIVHDHLLQYTARIAAELKLPVAQFTIRGKTYLLPATAGGAEHLILLPKDILRELPTALHWRDIDVVCAYNDELRERMKKSIGETWYRVVADNRKSKIKEALLKNPEVLHDLVQSYRKRPAVAYDFAADPQAEYLLLEAIRDFVEKFPLDLKKPSLNTAEEVLAVVRSICNHFRQLVENNGLSDLLWDGDKPRKEKAAQRLFFAVADAYCKANDLDLTPEADAGRGPVDFKTSKGYAARVLVEIKLSKNSKLVHGYQTQLAEYEKAEQTTHTIFLVVIVRNNKKKMDELNAVQTAAQKEKKRAPEIKYVDARPKASASTYEGDDADEDDADDEDDDE